MKKTALMTSFVLAASLSSAVADAAASYSSDRYVEEVWAEDPNGNGGEIYIKFSSTPFTTNCSQGNSLWEVGGDANTVKAIQAIALAAKLSRTHVQVAWNTSSGLACSGTALSGYPLVRGLKIRPGA